MPTNKESMQDLIDDSILATPMPQASSTVDKRTKYKTFIELPHHHITEKSAMEQGIAAIEEMKKKLSTLSYSGSSNSSWNYDSVVYAVSSNSGSHKKHMSELSGDIGTELNDQSFAKKEMLTEESGFTYLHNISELERDEIYCRESRDHIPIEKINMSISAVENSKIVPPDFMPAEDSLFSGLQSYNNKEENKFFIKEENSAQGESFLKHDDLTQLSKEEIPSIADIALVLKNCKEDANPRKIMDQVLKAGDKKTHINDKLSLNIKKDVEVIESDRQCSSSINVTAKNAVTYEECLIWGNVEIGHSRKRVLHIIHRQEEEDIYTISINGSNAFKILVNLPKESSLSCSVSVAVKHSSIYELQIVFQPNIIGQSTGFIKIESKSNKIFNRVYLYGFGGKSRLLMHGITFDPSLNSQSLTLSSGLKTAFTLENIGSATLFFYFSLGVLEEFFDILPKLGIIKANQVVHVVVSLIFKKETFSNLFHENYMEIGKLFLYYGDESSRLRLHNLSSKYTEVSQIKMIEKNYPFLTCSSFPSSDMDVSLLNDTKASFTDLVHDVTNKTSMDIKAGRDVLSQVLRNIELEWSKELQIIVKESKMSIVKHTETMSNEF